MIMTLDLVYPGANVSRVHNEDLHRYLGPDDLDNLGCALHAIQVPDSFQDACIARILSDTSRYQCSNVTYWCSSGLLP